MVGLRGAEVLNRSRIRPQRARVIPGLLLSRPVHVSHGLVEKVDRFVTGRSKDTRRRLLSLGFGFAALAVFGCGVSAAASGSGSGGSNSGSGGSGGSGSSGSGSGSGGSSGSGGGNSGPDGGDNSGSGRGEDGDDETGGKKAGRSNAQVERYLDTLRSRGRVVWANDRDGSIEVRYSDGWSEQVTSRRYRLRDPARRIVIERAAKALDFERLRSAAH